MPSLAIQRGQTLGANDLNIFIRDRSGNFVDPYEISYALFEMPQNILFGPVNSVPSKSGVGQYYAPFQVPVDMHEGDYLIRWFLKETSSSPQTVIEEQFAVVGLEYMTSNMAFQMPMAELIWLTRIRLGDNWPDRHYNFNPPSLEKEIQQYSKVFGFIWEDWELSSFLDMALDEINMYPPVTRFAIQGGMFPIQYRSLIVTGAAAKAAAEMMAVWTVNGFEYSIGGKSLSIDKASKYEALKSNLEGQFRAQIEAVKPKGPGSMIVKGLQQSFYGISARSSLGPFTGRMVLTARSYTRLGQLR